MADKNIKEYKKNLAQAISFRLKKCREAQGLSYAELSERTGISKSSLQRYETGATQTISLSAVSLIEKALNLESGYLLGWVPEKNDYFPFFVEERPTLSDDDEWPLFTYRPVFEVLSKKGTEANFLVFAPDSSMEKSGIKKGAAVFVNTSIMPRNGEICAISHNNTTYVCHIKNESGTYCFYTSDANVIKFSSDLEADHITCLGKAVASLNIL